VFSANVAFLVSIPEAAGSVLGGTSSSSSSASFELTNLASAIVPLHVASSALCTLASGFFAENGLVPCSVSATDSPVSTTAPAAAIAAAVPTEKDARSPSLSIPASIATSSFMNSERSFDAAFVDSAFGDLALLLGIPMGVDARSDLRLS